MPESRHVRRFWQRVVLRLLTSPLTLLPLLVGATCLLLAWAVAAKAGMLLFTGFVSLLIGLGTFLSRLFTGGEQIQRGVLEELDRESEAERERALDELDRVLTHSDDDPRPEQALRELRALTAAFQKDAMSAAGVNAQSRLDISTDVNHLFDTSVDYLRKTLEIWETTQQVQTPEVRKAMLEHRETLIREVRSAIVHIGSILSQLQTLGVTGPSGSSLGRIREELDTSLEVAKRVKDRIASWQSAEYGALEPGSH